MSSTVQTISRPACVLTGAEDIELLYSFKNFPIYVGCVDSTNSEEDVFCNMDWGYSTSSGSLQLMNLLDPTVLYTQNHGPGTVGKIWQEHHKKFFNFISQHSFNNVLEIGGASGSLVKHFLNLEKQFNWTIIEPSNSFNIKDDRVNFINGFFEDFSEDKKFDTIIHSHVFEHAYDPLSFLQKIHNLLELGNNHFITLPNMKHWIEQGSTNALIFEHTFYIDDNVLEYMLNKTNFEVIEKKVEEHSIFIHCKKTKNINLKTNNFSYTKDLYLNYINNLEKDLKSILEKIKNSKVFLFGGHIFSQMLINLGLNEKQVICVLDNDVKKHGKRLYGTNLIVQSPEILKNIIDPIVIVRSGVYTKEISESLLTINLNTRII